MSDWEDAEIEIPVVAKFEEEEVSDKEQPTHQVKLPPVKKKTDIAQKNREKEEAKLQVSIIDKALNVVQETEEERRIRLKNQVLESDMANLLDLVGDLELSKSRDNSNTPFNLENMVPKTRAEVEDYEKKLINKLYSFDHYYHLVETLIRDLLVPLDLEESRKISATVSAMINEKQKQKKPTTKKKKTGKQAVVVQKEDLQGVNKYQTYDEFDDFM